MKLLRKAAHILAAASILANGPVFAAGEEQMQVTGAVGEGQEASQYLNGKIQAGYFVPTFVQIDRVQAQRVDRRNGVEHMLVSSYKADDAATANIVTDRIQHDYNAQTLAAEMAQRAAETVRVADANSMNRYRPYEDGKIEYYQDGLVARIDNERVTDEFGNISRKNSYNFTYNDKRMLTGYEAMTTNAAGVSTYERLFGVTYTANSVYWGNYNTDADQLRLSYGLQVRDALGNNRLMHWNTAEENYIDKFLYAFSETIDDDLYGHQEFTQTDIRYETGDPRQVTGFHEEGVRNGLIYTKDRSGVRYNLKNQVLGYHEETKEGWDGVEGEAWDSLIITDTEYSYTPWNYRPDDSNDTDPDRLSGIISKSVRTDSDKSWKGTAEDPATAVTTYTYNKDMKLIDASTVENFVAGDEFNNLSSGTTRTYYGLDFSMYYGTPIVTRTETATESFDRPAAAPNRENFKNPQDYDNRYNSGLVPDIIVKYAANGGPNNSAAYNPAFSPRKHEESTVNYIRNSYGILTGASDTTTFVGDNGYSDNIYWGTSSNQYSILFQEPRVSTSTVTRNTQLENDDWSSTTLTTKYNYDANGKLVLSGSNGESGSSETTVGYTQGSGYFTTTNDPEKPNTYQVIHGKLKETTGAKKTVTNATEITKPFTNRDFQTALDEYAQFILKTNN